MNKKIFLTACSVVIFGFHFGYAQTKENSANDCSFLPAGYKASFTISPKGELKNSAISNLVPTLKDKTSQNYSFTTNGNNVITSDYIQMKKDDDEAFGTRLTIKVGTKNPDLKKNQLLGTQINTISEYESVVLLKNGQCQLQSMTAKFADSNKKTLLYDIAVCADLLEKWEQMSTRAEIANWYTEKNKKFEKMGLSLAFGDNSKSKYDAITDVYMNCRSTLKKNDPSFNLNTEVKQKPLLQDYISPDDLAKKSDLDKKNQQGFFSTIQEKIQNKVKHSLQNQ